MDTGGHHASLRLFLLHYSLLLVVQLECKPTDRQPGREIPAAAAPAVVDERQVATYTTAEPADSAAITQSHMAT